VKIKYNVVVALLLLAYSLPGLFLASYIPFFEGFLSPVNIWPLVTAALIQALLFFVLFPKIDLRVNINHLRKVYPNRLGIKIIKIIYITCVIFVLSVEFDALMKANGQVDRNFLYQIYRQLTEIYPIEKIKTFIAAVSIYLVVSGSWRIGLGSCIAISAIDFGFGNRGFAFYTLLIFIFAYMPLAAVRRNRLSLYVGILTLVLFMLLRTYLFSGDIEISGFDHLLAVMGEFVFTSSAPLFVHQMGADGDLETMFMQLLGLDKLIGMRAMWVGEIVQQDLAIPIGLACGPLCEVYYYAPDTLSLTLSTVGISILYAMFVRLSVKIAPAPERMLIIIVQLILLRDIVRTGLVVSFSTLALWTLIALALNRIFFLRK